MGERSNGTLGKLVQLQVFLTILTTPRIDFDLGLKAHLMKGNGFERQYKLGSQIRRIYSE